MKKVLCIGLAAVLAFGVITMSGCGNKEEPEETTVATTTEPTTTTEKETTEEVTFKTLYTKKVDALVDEYGSVNGGKLVDMDADGTPEMIVYYGSVPDLTVEIYTVQDKKAVSVYQGTAGVRYGQTDASYQIWLNESISPTALILFASTDEWEDETIYAVSISNGAASTEELKAATDGENDDPDRSWLQNCSINGESVSEGDYNTEYERLKTGAEIIDPTASDLDSLRSALTE